MKQTIRFAIVSSMKLLKQGGAHTTHMQRGRVVGVLFLSAVLLLSSCANGPGPSAGEGGAVSVADPSDYPPTLKELLGTGEERAALERLQFAIEDKAVADCVTNAGFGQQYIPAKLTQGPVRMYAPDIFTPPLPLEQAQAHGWGIIEFLMGPTDLPAPYSPDPEQSQAYSVALSECEFRREHAEVPGNPSEELVTDAEEAALRGAGMSVLDDPVFVQATHTWEDCMADHGLGNNINLYGAIDELIQQGRGASGTGDMETLETLRAQEVAIAVADSTCRTPIYGTLLQARADDEAPAIAKYHDLLDQIQAAWANIVAQAPTREQSDKGGIYPAAPEG